VSLLSGLFGEKRQRCRLEPLYRAVVAAGRAPVWYREGQVPDTIEGRFDMIASILALVLLRLEREGDGTRADRTLLTEAFIHDMDGSLRQIGIGDFVVGKHVGKLVGALGGRLGAFRAALAGEANLEAAVWRNVFRADPPSPEAAALVAARLRDFHAALRDRSLDQLLEGRLPTP
jgi:cytochrome b pre-mRNA-processing protein 3